jgi:hypothetical protein
MTHVEDTLKYIDVLVLKHHNIDMRGGMMIKLQAFFTTTLQNCD